MAETLSTSVWTFTSDGVKHSLLPQRENSAPDGPHGLKRPARHSGTSGKPPAKRRNPRP